MTIWKIHFSLGLRGVKRELLLSLTKCGTQQCRDVLVDFEIGKLDINGIDYNQVQKYFFFVLFSHINNTDSFHAKDVRQILSKGMCSVNGDLRIFLIVFYRR